MAQTLGAQMRTLRTQLQRTCMYLVVSLLVLKIALLPLHTSAPVAALVPEMIDVAWEVKFLK